MTIVTCQKLVKLFGESLDVVLAPAQRHRLESLFQLFVEDSLTRLRRIVRKAALQQPQPRGEFRGPAVRFGGRCCH